jgi:hypothetical protein
MLSASLRKIETTVLNTAAAFAPTALAFMQALRQTSSYNSKQASSQQSQAEQLRDARRNEAVMESLLRPYI